MKEKEELMKLTRKLNTITLHKGKLALTFTHESKILDFALYNRAPGNVVTNNEIIYKLWSTDDKIRKNHRVHFRNCVIVLCPEII